MALGPIKPVIFKTDQELGEAAARVIFAGIKDADTKGEKFVLGCPGGRSPRSTFHALGKMVSENHQSLKHLYLAMMDEYVTKSLGGEFENVEEDSHFSCRKFAFDEIRDVLNAGLAPDLQIPFLQVLIPDAQHPDEYESLLRELEVDIFILAAGASDGHVAFNGAGTERSAISRVTALSDETREDNLHTFPNFKSRLEVPKFGVTVGPDTIASVSKQTIMLLQGRHKQLAFQRITATEKYQKDWPATIITECRNPLIFADEAAAGLL